MPRGPHKSQIKKHVCQTHRPCTWSLICLWPYRSSCRRCSAGSSCPNVFRWTEPLEFPFPDSLSRTWGACDSPPRHHTAASSWSLTRETKFTLDEKKKTSDLNVLLRGGKLPPKVTLAVKLLSKTGATSVIVKDVNNKPKLPLSVRPGSLRAVPRWDTSCAEDSGSFGWRYLNTHWTNYTVFRRHLCR